MRINHYHLSLILAIALGASVAAAQTPGQSSSDTTTTLIRGACDAESPLELREFKQRQVQRRKTYLVGALEAMKNDILSNASTYSAEDRRDFEETASRIQAEIAEVHALDLKGCSEKSLTDVTLPEGNPGANSRVIAASLRKSSATISQQPAQSRSATSQPATQPISSQGAKQDAPPKATNPKPTETAPAKNEDAATKPEGDDVAKLKEQVKSIQDALSTENQDFALVLGVGSMVINPHVSDYKNDSNVLHTTNLGSSTPQLLTGVSFRSRVPGFARRFVDCTSSKGIASSGANALVEGTKKCGEPWQVHPWSGFVSLKFAPGASQLLNGYVIGGTYSITKYLNALIGFSMTPINESSPGFRVTASQFVTNQQKLVLDLNFSPTAMLLNRRNAFDGFPVTDPSGKLLYPGDPLTVHYRAGAVFGVSFPIYFRSLWKPSASDAK